MSLPEYNTTVHIQTELQYDVDAQQPAFPAGSLSAITVTCKPQDGSQMNVYCINGGKIWCTFQENDSSGSGSTPWVIEDMHFCQYWNLQLIEMEH
jgi:hypothetical protein